MINKLKILKKFAYPEMLIKEYNNWYLLLRADQVTIGSLVLICKDKVGAYSDISVDSNKEFHSIIQEIENSLKRLFNYSKINYLMLMMVDNIVHYHIIPRYENDIELFNVNYKDSCWPNPPDLSKKLNLDQTMIYKLKDLLANDINGNLNGGQKKYGLVYTTGVFDVFHYGHLNMLMKSKEICDFLLVGVSTDELVMNEKNKIPLITFHQRVEILKSIIYVDQVIEQKDKNKQKVVDEYKVDAITVGDDWKGKYPNVSCELIYFPYTPLISSTKIRANL